MFRTSADRTGLVLLCFCIWGLCAPTSFGLTTNTAKRVLVSTHDVNKDDLALLREPDANKLATSSKKLNYQLVTTEKYCFLINKDVLPDPDTIAMRQALIKALLDGKAMDGQVLDLGKLDPALSQELFNTVCNFRSELSQLGSPSKMRVLVDTPANITITANGRSTTLFYLDSRNPEEDDKNQTKAEISTDPNTKLSDYKIKPSKLFAFKEQEDQVHLAFAFTLTKNEQFEASILALNWIRDETAKETKDLDEANAFMLSQLASRFGQDDLKNSGNYTDLPEYARNDLRSKMLGLKDYFGLKNDGEVDKMLSAATYRCQRPGLYLRVISRDMKGNRSIGMIPVPLTRLH